MERFEATHIDTAIIPAAGFGTRFLPWTKAVPKEMLPIVDKPVIEVVVRECADSGVDNLIVVVSGGKEAIVKHFSEPSADLSASLLAAGKDEQLTKLKEIASMAKFTFLEQPIGQYGNGIPVLASQSLIASKQMFAVVWGDEFILGAPRPRPNNCIS